MSDGTTTSITGIKGADGKDGTEWTIGEDGFWYKDGEKTTSQAIAKMEKMVSRELLLLLPKSTPMECG